MKLRIFLLLAILSSVSVFNSFAQTYQLKDIKLENEKAFASEMSSLAAQLLENETINKDLNNRFRLQLLSGQYNDALESIKQIRTKQTTEKSSPDNILYLQYEIFIKAEIQVATDDILFKDAYRQAFTSKFKTLNDQQAYQASQRFVYFLGRGKATIQQQLKKVKEKSELTKADALQLARRYQVYSVYKNTLPLTEDLLAKDNGRRYVIQDSVLIKTDEGATLSAIVVRQKDSGKPQPSALQFTIYTREANQSEAIHAASHGYIGIVADTRGKRLSPNKIEPYEHEVNDVDAVIDWISKQPWSDGRVGMYGGSYSGFAQWAATKSMHPALKTIVPYVAAIPGYGLPMENNIFLNANYYWPFYVTNNKYLDNEVYANNANELAEKWYQSGRPYNEIDDIDGRPNPWLQRWLSHPSYDEYWQQMVPYKTDYKNIDIPVLTITGYYDDGQISALHYLNQHYKYNKDANHYLLIGPYDHWTAQNRPTPVLRGYKIDSVAHINTPEITFQWLDYVLKDAEKPALTKDKVNYQLMGSNTWQHESSLASMNREYERFYLSTDTTAKYHQLSKQKDDSLMFLTQEVDFTDRTTTNNDYYPWPIIKDQLKIPNGFAFVSKPFEEETELSGSFSGELNVKINKRDFDVGLIFYELMPDGRAFHLSYHLGRASYAKDMTKRQLLTPNEIESIPFEHTRMVSKQIKKGSRLLVLVNVNKNPHAQINYGTGKDVSEESISDAKEPLVVHWYNDSYINIPIQK